MEAKFDLQAFSAGADAIMMGYYLLELTKILEKL